MTDLETPSHIRTRVFDRVSQDLLLHSDFPYAPWTEYLVSQMCQTYLPIDLTKHPTTFDQADEDPLFVIKSWPRGHEGGVDVTLKAEAGAKECIFQAHQDLKSRKGVFRAVLRAHPDSPFDPAYEPLELILNSKAIRETRRISPDKITHVPRSMVHLVRQKKGPPFCSTLTVEVFTLPTLDVLEILGLKFETTSAARERIGLARADVIATGHSPGSEPVWASWEAWYHQIIAREVQPFPQPIFTIKHSAHLGINLSETKWAPMTHTDREWQFPLKDFLDHTTRDQLVPLDNALDMVLLNEFDGQPFNELSSSSRWSAPSREQPSPVNTEGVLILSEPADDEGFIIEPPLVPWRHSDIVLFSQPFEPIEPIIDILSLPSSPAKPLSSADPHAGRQYDIGQLDAGRMMRSISTRPGSTTPRSKMAHSSAAFAIIEDQQLSAHEAQLMRVPRMAAPPRQHSPATFAQAVPAQSIRGTERLATQLGWRPYHGPSHDDASRLQASNVASFHFDGAADTIQQANESLARPASSAHYQQEVEYQPVTVYSGQTPSRTRWEVGQSSGFKKVQTPVAGRSRVDSQYSDEASIATSNGNGGRSSIGYEQPNQRTRQIRQAPQRQQGRQLQRPTSAQKRMTLNDFAGDTSLDDVVLGKRSRADEADATGFGDFLNLSDRNELAPSCPAPSHRAPQSPVVPAPVPIEPKNWRAHPAIKNPAWYADLLSQTTKSSVGPVPVLASVNFLHNRHLVRVLHQCSFEILERDATVLQTDLALSPRTAVLFRQLSTLHTARAKLVADAKCAAGLFQRVLIVIEVLSYSLASSNDDTASVDPLTTAALDGVSALRRSIEIGFVLGETAFCKPQVVFACNGPTEIGNLLRLLVQEENEDADAIIGEHGAMEESRLRLAQYDQAMSQESEMEEKTLVKDFGINSFSALFILERFGTLSSYAFDLDNEQRVKVSAHFAAPEAIARFNGILRERRWAVEDEEVSQDTSTEGMTRAAR